MTKPDWSYGMMPLSPIQLDQDAAAIILIIDIIKQIQRLVYPTYLHDGLRQP